MLWLLKRLLALVGFGHCPPGDGSSALLGRAHRLVQATR